MGQDEKQIDVVEKVIDFLSYNTKNVITGIIFFLKGKKTVLAGLGLVVNGLIKIANTGEWATGSEDILQGLGLIFLRNSIKK